MGIVVLYGYVLYKLFMGTIFWYGANNTSKMVRNVVISTILCFPIGICEMIYIHTKNKEVKTEG